MPAARRAASNSAICSSRSLASSSRRASSSSSFDSIRSSCVAAWAGFVTCPPCCRYSGDTSNNTASFSRFGHETAFSPDSHAWYARSVTLTRSATLGWVSRRALLTRVQIALFALAALLTLFTLMDRMTLVLLGVFAFAQGVLSAVEVTTRHSFFAELIDDKADEFEQALVEQFKADPHTSLFATMSFWQGVDLPGDTLTLVTIDRLPFPRPDDPLLEARRDLAGPSAFREIDLPRAATLLAQGAGRLIRTTHDRGVVAVLDPRLAKNKSYRWDIINALPPMRRTRSIST